MRRPVLVLFLYWLNLITGALEVVVLGLGGLGLTLLSAMGGPVVMLFVAVPFAAMVALGLVRLHAATGLRMGRRSAPAELVLVALIDGGVHVFLGSLGTWAIAVPALLDLTTVVLVLGGGLIPLRRR